MMNNTDPNREFANNADTKKTWVTPSIELISKDIIKGGSVSTIPESVTTFTVFHGSAS